MAKLFTIFSALLALMISNFHVAVSIRTIGVAPSSPMSKDCSVLFSADMGDYCAPFLSNEESEPDNLLCCSALDYQSSLHPECFCDMTGNNNLSSSFKKLPSLCQLTLPCDINASQASSPVSSVPSPAPESESPTPSPSVTSPKPNSPTPTPSVAPSPEPKSPTPTPSVAPSPEPQSPSPTPSVEPKSPTTSSTPSAPSPSPKALPNTSPEPKHSSASLAAQFHSLLVFVLLTTSILFV